jgi:nitrate reductase NapE component
LKKTKTVTSSEIKYLLHGFIMLFSWGLVGFMMCLSNRWMVHTSDYTQCIHTLLGLVIVIFPIVSICWVIAVRGFNLKLGHSLEGFIIVVGSVIVSIEGIYTYQMKKNLKWNSPYILKLRKYHRWSSVILILGSIYVNSAGIF